MRIGIMQGRLLPPVKGRFQCFPRECWMREFPLAAQAGLDSIEWIYDAYGEDVNPLANIEGISDIRANAERHGVKVVSVCADYFMDRPIVCATGSERNELLQRLVWLFGRCRLAGITRVVLPFVDSSRMDTPSKQDLAVAVLSEMLPEAERQGVEIHLETDLAPRDFAELLSRLPHSFLKVNYDTGNSSSLGYRPSEEVAAYGERIGSVHIKDRVFRGGTVALGAGDADFATVFARLAKLEYAGDFILQAARGECGDEAEWARHNRNFVLCAMRHAGLTMVE